LVVPGALKVTKVVEVTRRGGLDRRKIDLAALAVHDVTRKVEAGTTTEQVGLQTDFVALDVFRVECAGSRTYASWRRRRGTRLRT
jgi:hypothetical protein